MVCGEGIREVRVLQTIQTRWWWSSTSLTSTNRSLMYCAVCGGCLVLGCTAAGATRLIQFSSFLAAFQRRRVPRCSRTSRSLISPFVPASYPCPSPILSCRRMLVQETILCATGRAAANPAPGAITLHDFQTGATLASFKQTSAEQDCTAVVETSDGQGGFMLAAQSDKSVLNVYSFQKVMPRYLILKLCLIAFIRILGSAVAEDSCP